VLGVFLAALWGLGVALPSRYIGDGLDAFEGAEKAAASRALFDVTEYYGNGFLEIGDYNGPPLVLGWRVEAAEGCPGAPFGEEAVGANARIEAYGPFGLPRGEMEVACRGERVWESYW